MKLTKSKLREIIQEELKSLNEEILNEGFSKWEVEFGKGIVSGVDYSKAGKVSVKARNTIEAIKKAVNQVRADGGNADDWMAVDVEKLNKK